MSEKKEVLRNTIFLFSRMFLLLFLGLYTSRLVLSKLGVVDYGIYSLVAGMVVFFTIISNSITVAVQRFLNININNEKVLALYYFSAKKLFFLIGFFVFLLGEYIFYAFSDILNIPDDRKNILPFVIHLSLLCLFFQILRIPNNALILAHEKMSFIAYSSILEAFLKLIAIYILILIDGDHLIVYSILMAVIVFLMNIIYSIFVKKNYKRVFLFKNSSKKAVVEMLKFSGFSFLGSSGVVISQQGVALIINKYFTIILNTSNSLANQVYTVINGFVGSFQMAYTPLLMRTYHASQIEKCKEYTIDFSRYSLYLSMVVIIPIYVFLPDLLNLWLVEVPELTADFARIYLLILLIDVVSAPLWIIANAHGDMAKYQTKILFLTISNIPLTIILLSFHHNVVIIFYIKLFVSIITLLYRVSYVKKLLNIKIYNYFYNCFFIPVIIFSISIFVGFYSFYNNIIFENSIFNLLLTMMLISIITLMLIFILGLNSKERTLLISSFKSFLRVSG